MITAILIVGVLVIGAIALWAHVDVHRARTRRAADYQLAPLDGGTGGCRVTRVRLADGSSYFADSRGPRA